MDAESGRGHDTAGLRDVFTLVADRRRRRATGLPVVASSGAPSGGIADAGRVLAVEDLGDVRIIRVGRPAAFAFDAGQYLKVGLAGLRRASFSIASAPHDPYLELCIQRVPDGRLTPHLFRLRPGDVVELSDRAKGSLRLDPAASTHLMVGTGTGIAPLRSLVRDALHSRLPGRFLVLHGSSHVDGLPYRAELEELAATVEQLAYTPTISRPAESRNAGWLGRRGRVDVLAQQVAAGLDPSSTCIYATGAPAMVDSVRRTLGAAGFQVRTEAFT